MKLGICAATLEEIACAHKVGYDYFEFSFGKLGLMSDEEFAQLLALCEELDFWSDCMNLMVPAQFRLTGPEADLAPVLPFLRTAFARAKQLRTKVVVFGSSGARNVPEGFGRPEAYEQLEEYLRMAGREGIKHDIVVAIEHLSFGESNILNTIYESAYMAERVGLTNVVLMADSYHMSNNCEKVSAITTCGQRVCHFHIGRGGRRSFPMAGDGFDYAPFIAAAKAVGSRTITVEGWIYGGFENDARACYEFLRPQV